MLSTTCHNHPDRPAIAVCVSCRESICQSCSTLWEGMHHCVDCLAARRAAKVARGAVAASLVLLLISAGLLFAATHLRAVILALVAGKLS
ncbi:MAG TPA: B-box zinc finger protein [Thermoanaerobaculia bacterium]